MLSKLKNIKGYVGRGCVHWDGKYSHRPYKCIIKEVRLNTTYKKDSYGMQKDEHVEFVIYNPRLRKWSTVGNIELFDNFRECYRCICEYSSFKSLCDISRYDVHSETVAKDEINSCLRNLVLLADDEKTRNKMQNLSEYKRKIMEFCDGTMKKINETSVAIDHSHLLRFTLYGFIREMMKRYPDMDVHRAHRMSEISFEENGK